jgi:hypothetical protein
MEVNRSPHADVEAVAESCVIAIGYRNPKAPLIAF